MIHVIRANIFGKQWTFNSHANLPEIVRKSAEAYDVYVNYHIKKQNNQQ
jgi:hypothetical protein